MEQVVLNGETMGTTYSIKYNESKEYKSLQEEIDQYLLDFNALFSTYIPDSEISQINRSDDAVKEQGIEVSLQFQRILDHALEIASQSQGFFDPTVYPLVSLWGVNFSKREENLIPDMELIHSALNKVGYQKVKSQPGLVSLQAGMSIDLSALAKGSGVDGIASILEKNGIENYLVEIGGEIRVKGRNREGEYWKILIASPIDDIPDTDLSNDQMGDWERVVLSMETGAVATSGDYLSYFVHDGVKYSHLIDPHTGMPIRHYVTSVSVIADNCEKADGWATALIVMGEKGITFSEANGIPAIFMVRGEGDRIEVIKNKWVQPYLDGK